MSEDHPIVQRVACEKCGKEYGIGDSPWCRDDHTSGRFGFDAFTPYDDDQLGSDPVRIGNRGERLRYMEKNHIEYKDLSHYKTRLYLDMKKR